MRNLTYLLTGTLLFTSIIVGCKKDKSPSPSNSTGNQNSNIENISNTEDLYALTDSGSTSITDVDTNENRHNLSIKKWEFQVNDESSVTAISYGEDVFILERFMTTPNEKLILISANNITNNSISILKLTHKSEDNDTLIGQVQTVTHPDVVQEIRAFINDPTENIILDSYTEAGTFEDAIFNISFYQASYTMKDDFFFPNPLSANFTHRQRMAYLMIANTTVANNRYVDANIVIASTPAPKFPVPVNAMRHEEPLNLSFQQSQEDFSVNTPTTALMEGLNIKEYNTLDMDVNTVFNNQSIVFTFNRYLQIYNRETQFQVEITSDMKPLNFSVSLSNVARRTWLRIQEFMQSDQTQAALSTTQDAAAHSLEKSQEFMQSDAFQTAVSKVKEGASQYAMIKIGQLMQPPTPLFSLEDENTDNSPNNEHNQNQDVPYITIRLDE